MTPIWFLDFDGVLNSFPQPRFEQLMETQDWAEGEANGYRLWWQRSVVNRIAEIVNDKRVRMIWLTTWTTDAPRLLAPQLGLPDFPALVDVGGTAGPGLNWWKFIALREALAGADQDQQFVWTDDDLAFTPTVQAEVETVYPGQHLLLAPAANPGLTHQDLDRIEAFIDG